MANATTPQVVRSYLAQLEKALVGVAAEVRSEIVAGVAEELSGLGATEAAARIEELGDPDFIAAEARVEASAPIETVGQRSIEPGWYPVLAALLVAFGGIVIPIVGWIVGLAMVWFSKTWTSAEKLIALLTAPLAIVASVLISLVISWWGSPGSSATGPNPLIPTPFDLLWSGVFLFGGVNVVVGIWLLWRAKRNWSAPALTTGPQIGSMSAAAPQASWYPVVTVLLIVGGGYLLPVVGWVIGITMLWLGDRWSNRDKWLGSLVGPLASLVVLGVFLTVRGGALGNLDGWHAVILGSLAAPLIANVIVGIHLLRSVRRPTA